MMVPLNIWYHDLCALTANELCTCTPGWITTMERADFLPWPQSQKRKVRKSYEEDRENVEGYWLYTTDFRKVDVLNGECSTISTYLQCWTKSAATAVLHKDKTEKKRRMNKLELLTCLSWSRFLYHMGEITPGCFMMATGDAWSHLTYKSQWYVWYTSTFIYISRYWKKLIAKRQMLLKVPCEDCQLPMRIYLHAVHALMQPAFLLHLPMAQSFLNKNIYCIWMVY